MEKERNEVSTSSQSRASRRNDERERRKKGDLEGETNLDDEIEPAELVVERSRGVGSDDDLIVDGSLDLDVLSDGEAEVGRRRRKAEPVAASQREERESVGRWCVNLNSSGWTDTLWEMEGPAGEGEEEEG
jgi:hypothetical protein